MARRRRAGLSRALEHASRGWPSNTWRPSASCVATDPSYRGQLSEVSARTLRAQGGAMSPAEVERFRGNADWAQAVALRRIDDRGKIVGLEVPAVETYRGMLMRVVERAGATTASAAPAPPSPGSARRRACWRERSLIIGRDTRSRAPSTLIARSTAASSRRSGGRAGCSPAPVPRRQPPADESAPSRRRPALVCHTQTAQRCQRSKTHSGAKKRFKTTDSRARSRAGTPSRATSSRRSRPSAGGASGQDAIMSDHDAPRIKKCWGSGS